MTVKRRTPLQTNRQVKKTSKKFGNIGDPHDPSTAIKTGRLVTLTAYIPYGKDWPLGWQHRRTTNAGNTDGPQLAAVTVHKTGDTDGPQGDRRDYS